MGKKIEEILGAAIKLNEGQETAEEHSELTYIYSFGVPHLIDIKGTAPPHILC